MQGITHAILADIAREAGTTRETVAKRMLGLSGKKLLRRRIEAACAARGIELPPAPPAGKPGPKPRA